MGGKSRGKRIVVKADGEVLVTLRITKKAKEGHETGTKGIASLNSTKTGQSAIGIPSTR